MNLRRDNREIPTLLMSSFFLLSCHVCQHFYATLRARESTTDNAGDRRQHEHQLPPPIGIGAAVSKRNIDAIPLSAAYPVAREVWSEREDL